MATLAAVVRLESMPIFAFTSMTLTLVNVHLRFPPIPLTDVPFIKPQLATEAMS